MAGGAPRLPWPLVAEVRSTDDGRRPIADVWRDACAFAERRGFARPSYEHVRRLVLRERAIRELPGVAEPLVDGWFRARSPESAVEEAVRRQRERRAARARIDAEQSWRPDARSERGS
jgi:hypothetical protein